jgi:hypothetical protein
MVSRENWQLQYLRALARDQSRHHQHLAVWKLQRVMMNAGIVDVDLPKTSNLVLRQYLPPSKQNEVAFILHISLEGHLGAGKHAHGNIGIPDGSEAASQRFREIRCHELISNLGWTRGDEV